MPVIVRQQAAVVPPMVPILPSIPIMPSLLVTDSTLSQLHLDNAHVFFDHNGTGLYQSLKIELGILPYALDGKNGASITFNSLLNTGGASANQFTDRLLINGNVLGTTLINIKEVAGSPGGLTSPGGNNLNNEGISLIQVSGSAAETSFALAGGHVAMGGLPYIYTLHVYGPS